MPCLFVLLGDGRSVTTGKTQRNSEASKRSRERYRQSEQAIHEAVELETKAAIAEGGNRLLQRKGTATLVNADEPLGEQVALCWPKSTQSGALETTVPQARDLAWIRLPHRGHHPSQRLDHRPLDKT